MIFSYYKFKTIDDNVKNYQKMPFWFVENGDYFIIFPAELQKLGLALHCFNKTLSDNKKFYLLTK